MTGLTTAATIWLCAVLGVARGLGYWSVLGIALGLTVLVLALGGPIEYLAKRLFKRPIEYLTERLFKPKRSKPTDPSV